MKQFTLILPILLSGVISNCSMKEELLPNPSAPSHLWDDSTPTNQHLNIPVVHPAYTLTEKIPAYNPYTYGAISGNLNNNSPAIVINSSERSSKISSCLSKCMKKILHPCKTCCESNNSLEK